MVRFASAKERIEKTPEIIRKEMVWFKGKAGELRPVATERKSYSVASESPYGSDKSIIHTHSFAHHPVSLDHGRKSLPSAIDLFRFINYAWGDTNIRTFVVSSIDLNGEVMGYVFMKAKKDFVDLAKTMKTKYDRNTWGHLRDRREKEFDTAKWMLEQTIIECIRHRKATPSDLSSDILEIFSKIGVRVRHLPMPGYGFSEGEFVRMDQEKK